MLIAREVMKTFGSVRALGPVSFELPRGSQIALLGVSGSGKSTLLNLLGCMETVSSGELTLDGVSLAALDERQLAAVRLRKIGYVHQFFDLLEDLTALENVMLPLWMAGEDRSEERARELLARLGLSHRMNQVASVLSGGEKQRVAIARALSLSPPLILADEPSGSLDRATGESVIDLLIEKSKESGATLILATHSGAAAGRFEKFIRLEDGKIVQSKL